MKKLLQNVGLVLALPVIFPLILLALHRWAKNIPK